jgi:hypothetical protein
MEVASLVLTRSTVAMEIIKAGLHTQSLKISWEAVT